MSWSVTGHRPGATSKTRCVDVAALVAAAILRKNPNAEVIPFHNRVEHCRLNGRDSVMTNAQKLSSLPSGGTTCAAPIAYLNKKAAKGDLIIMVSDNESWGQLTGRTRYSYGWDRSGATDMAGEWAKFKKRNRGAKMICLDLVPNDTTQVKNSDDVLNVGGFSDVVFDIFAAFAKGDLGNEALVGVIESVRLDGPNVRKAHDQKQSKVKVCKHRR